MTRHITGPIIVTLLLAWATKGLTPGTAYSYYAEVWSSYGTGYGDTHALGGRLQHAGHP